MARLSPYSTCQSLWGGICSSQRSETKTDRPTGFSSLLPTRKGVHRTPKCLPTTCKMESDIARLGENIGTACRLCSRHNLHNHQHHPPKPATGCREEWVSVWRQVLFMYHPIYQQPRGHSRVLRASSFVQSFEFRGRRRRFPATGYLSLMSAMLCSVACYARHMQALYTASPSKPLQTPSLGAAGSVAKGLQAWASDISYHHQ
jgi:hypothetical protein